MENELREKILSRLLSTRKRHIILELGTGIGKTRLALQKVEQLYKPFCSILIVIPRKVLIQNWKDEFHKWHYDYMLSNVTFVTYISFPKMVGSWDIIIFDEAHHLTERCRDALPSISSKYTLYLSATLSHDWMEFLYGKYYSANIEHIKVTTQKAIDEEVLPDPKIELYGFRLNNAVMDQFYYPKKSYSKRPSACITIAYRERWKFKNYSKPYRIQCTQQEYYNLLSGLIDWYKNRIQNPIMKNRYLQLCGERLKWLSQVKVPVTMQLMKQYSRHRMVVFCNTIEESRKFHLPCVNSKVGTRSLEEFNNKKIKAVAAVNMLNEGINLVNCQVGIFNAINASPVMQIQKQGRILRHQHPIMVIPFFLKTREQEILTKWFAGYNPDLITFHKPSK